MKVLFLLAFLIWMSSWKFTISKTISPCNELMQECSKCENVTLPSKEYIYTCAKCVSGRYLYKSKIELNDQLVDQSICTEECSDISLDHANDPLTGRCRSCGDDCRRCHPIEGCLVQGTHKQIFSSDCYSDCIQCYGFGSKECTRCKVGMYLNNTTCMNKTGSSSLNIFISSQTTTSQQMEDGSLQFPYTDFLRAVDHMYQKTSPFVQSTVNIWIQDGNHFILPNPTSMFNDQLFPYSTNDLSTIQIHISALHCGILIDGILISSSHQCIEKGSKAQIFNKIGGFFRFKIGASLTLKYIVIDSIDSQVDHSEECWKQKIRCCKFSIGHQVEGINGVKCKSLTSSPRCDIDLQESMFQYSPQIDNNKIPIFEMSNVEIRHIFYSLHSIINLRKNIGITQVLNSSFHTMGGCVPIISTTQHPKSEYIHLNQTSIRQTLQFQSIDLANSQPGPRCTKSNCATLHMVSCTVRDYFIDRTFQDSVYMSVKQSNPHLISLNSFPGYVLLKDNTFVNNQVKISKCKSYTNQLKQIGSKSINDSSGTIYLKYTQQTQPFIGITGTKAEIEIIGNRFTNSSGYQQAIILIHKEAQDQPVIIKANEFIQNSGVYASKIIEVQDSTSCRSILVSDNVFSLNMRCEPDLNEEPHILYMFCPNNHPIQNDITTTSTSGISYNAGAVVLHANWYESNYYSLYMNTFYIIPKLLISNETYKGNVDNIFIWAADLLSPMKTTLGDFQTAFISPQFTDNTPTSLNHAFFQYMTVEYLDIQNQYTVSNSQNFDQQTSIYMSKATNHSFVAFRHITIKNMQGIDRQFLSQFTPQQINENQTHFQLPTIALQKGYFSTLFIFSDIGQHPIPYIAVHFEHLELTNVQMAQVNKSQGLILDFQNSHTNKLVIDNIEVHGDVSCSNCDTMFFQIDMYYVKQCVIQNIKIRNLPLTNKPTHTGNPFMIKLQPNFQLHSILIQNVTITNVRTLDVGFIYFKPITLQPSKINITIQSIRCYNVKSGQGIIHFLEGASSVNITIQNAIFMNNAIRNRNKLTHSIITIRNCHSSKQIIMLQQLQFIGIRCLRVWRNDCRALAIQLEDQSQYVSAKMRDIYIDCQEPTMLSIDTMSKSKHMGDYFSSVIYSYKYRLQMFNVNIQNCHRLEVGVLRSQLDYLKIYNMNITNCSGRYGAGLSIDSYFPALIYNLTTFNLSSVFSPSINLVLSLDVQVHDSNFINCRGYYSGCLFSSRNPFKLYRSNFINNTGVMASVINYKLSLEDHFKTFITNCTFIDNIATGYQGATISLLDILQIRITGTLFHSNKAEQGYDGILSITSLLSIKNITFSGTSSGSSKGGHITALLNSVVRIVNSRFQNSLLNKGGAIGIEAGSNISMINCEFNNITSTKGSVIYLQSSNLVILKNIVMSSCNLVNQDLGGAYLYGSRAQFTNISNVSLIGMSQNQFVYFNLASLEIHSLTIIGSEQKYQKFDIKSLHGGGLHLVDMQMIRVIGLDIRNLRYAKKGGALAITHTSNKIKPLQPYTLHQVSFISNQAFRQGGGLFLQNIPEISFEGLIIQNNSVLDGEGGGIYIDSSQLLDRSTIGILQDFEVSGNHVNGSGGGVSWNKYGLPMGLDKINGNTATVYGQNFASYPVKIQLVTQNEIIRGTISQNRILTQSPLIRSGGMIPIFRYALVDKIGQIVRSDNNSEAKISSLTTSSTFNIVLKSQFSYQALKGVFTFDDLQLIGEPGTQVHLQVESLVLDPTLPDFAKESNQSIISISLRKCIVGEAFLLTGECQRCENTTQYLLNIQTKTGTCKECVQEYMICRGGNDIGPRPTYWRANNESSNFYKCIFPFQCLGMKSPKWSAVGECRQGSHGRLCAVCDMGYSSTLKHECVKCNNLWVNVLRLIIVMILGMVWIIYLVNKTIQSVIKQKKKIDSIFLKILINHVQLNYLCSTFDFQWPYSVQLFFNSQDYVANVGSQFIQSTCIYQYMSISSTYFFNLLQFAILPILLIVASSIFWLIKTSKCLRGDKQLFLKRNISTIVILIVLFHPQIVKKMFDSINCIKIDGDLYMIDQMNQLCYRSSHLIWMVTISIPSLVIWGVGTPLLSWLILFKNRHRIESQVVNERYGFLYYGYKRDKYFWESLIMFKKIILILVNVQFKLQGSTVQALIVIALLTSFMVLTRKYKPFVVGKLNYLELTSIQVSLVTIYSGLIFLLHRPDVYNNPSHEIRTADNGLRLTQFHYITLFLLVVLSNSYFFLYWVYHYLKQLKFSFIRRYPILYRVLFLCNSQHKYESKLTRIELQEESEYLKQELQQVFDGIMKSCNKQELVLNREVLENLKEYLDLDRIKEGIRYQPRDKSIPNVSKVQPMLSKRHHTYQEQFNDITLEHVPHKIYPNYEPVRTIYEPHKEQVEFSYEPSIRSKQLVEEDQGDDEE